MIEVRRPSEQPLRNANYLETKLANAAGEKKEALAKWKRDYPDKPESGASFRRNTWKAYGEHVTLTDDFRKGYDSICWDEACAAHHHELCSRVSSPDQGVAD